MQTPPTSWWSPRRAPPDSTPCAVCFPGYAPSPAGDACYCAKGWYNGNVTDGSCRACGPGAYCPGASETSPRIACPPNTYTFSLDAGSTADCLAMQGFSGVPGKATPCARGTFKMTIGNTACTSCPAGVTTAGTGAVFFFMCSVTLPGYGVDAGAPPGAAKAVACPANFFRAGEVQGPTYQVEVATLDPVNKPADLARLQAQPWWADYEEGGNQCKAAIDIATYAPVATKLFQDWNRKGDAAQPRRSGVFVACAPDKQAVGPDDWLTAGQAYYSIQGRREPWDTESLRYIPGPQQYLVVAMPTTQVTFKGKAYATEVATLDPVNKPVDLERLRAQPWWADYAEGGNECKAAIDIATYAPVATKPFQDWNRKGDAAQPRRSGVFVACAPDKQAAGPDDWLAVGQAFYAVQGGKEPWDTEVLRYIPGPQQYLAVAAPATLVSTGVPCVRCPAGLVRPADVLPADSAASCKAPA